MSTITVAADVVMATEDAARADVTYVITGQEGFPLSDRREIRDSTALAIAADWQSPGAVGRYLAQLASTRRVVVEDLLDDIHRSREWARDEGTITPRDEQHLSCLATWAMNHPSRDYRDECSHSWVSGMCHVSREDAEYVSKEQRVKCERCETEYDPAIHSVYA